MDDYEKGFINTLLIFYKALTASIDMDAVGVAFSDGIRLVWCGLAVRVMKRRLRQICRIRGMTAEVQVRTI